jgi:glycosyltransferase involved in cell wall biosynthesis
MGSSPLRGAVTESSPRVSVLITTRNRRDELLRALRSVFDQDVRPIEVIVLDDGSTDGTSDAVAASFPEARVERSDDSLGLIAQRNRGARLASAPIIGFLDDDCELSDPGLLAAGLAGFDHPRVGVVALPMVEFGAARPGIFNLAPSADGVFVTDTYAGGASLLRRDAFLWLGGYRSDARRGEDSDHARRMLQHGMVVRVVRAAEVRHYVSNNTRARDTDVYWQARTNVLATVWSLPLRMLPRRAILSLGHGARHGKPLSALRGIASGLRSARAERARRNALEPRLARAVQRMESERMRRAHSLRLEELEPYLPALAPEFGRFPPLY